MTEELKTIDSVDTSPFRKMVMTIGELPTSFVDSMTYYELLAWLCNYLENTVINAVNNNAEVSQELQDKFIELKSYVDNYFDNLDVQEEINNKLDAMVEAGTLQEIITAYIQANVAWCFDTVAGMKASTNFVNGSFAQTLGYHTKNDGGAALYKIRTITNDDVVDEKFIIELADDTLIAELILVNGINVKQLGAYGDDTHDDTTTFESALAKDHVKIYIPSGTYIISEPLTLSTFTTIDGDGSSSIIKAGTDFGSTYLFNVPYSSRFCTIKNIYLEGLHLANGIRDGYGDNPLATRLNMLNLEITNCKTSVYLNSIGSTINNCFIIGEYTLDNSGREQIGIYINSTDNMIENTRVSCFTEYGIYCLKGSNKFNNVKCMLSGTGCYLKGENISAVMEAQENFHDNFKLYRVLDSNLTLNTSGAGIVEKTGETIPTTLTNYSLLDIEECKSNVIDFAGGIRESYDDTWSCEGNVIKMVKSIGLSINGNCFTHTESTAQPKMINADTITGNDVTINGFKYFNDLRKQSVTILGYSNTTINYQDGDNYDLTLAGGATGNIGFIHFAYDGWDKMALFSALSEQITITQVSFRYTVSGTTYGVTLSSNVARDNTAHCGMYRIIEDISTTLANNAQYQEFISQSATITNKEIQIQINITNSVISDRSHIKGLLEVYAN